MGEKKHKGSKAACITPILHVSDPARKSHLYYIAIHDTYGYLLPFNVTQS